MAALNAFGHVTLRPVRVALVDEFVSRDALRRASQLASSHWGGVDYLLLPAPLADRAVEVARTLADVATPLQGSADASILPSDLTYRSWPSGDPFDRGDGSVRNHVLSMESFTTEPTGVASIAAVDRVVWDEEHPLADVLTVLHGDLGRAGSTEYAPVERSREDLGRAGAVPATAFSTGPLARTRHGLFPRSPESYRGLVCVDPTSVHDLIGFWNLRASGANVALYPLGHESAVGGYLDAWFAELPDGTDDAMLWSASADLARQVSGELRRHFGGDFVPQRLSAVPDWVYVIPIESHYSQRFDVNMDEDAWQVRLPLPRLAFLPAASWYERFGIVSADIEISTASRMQGGRNFSVPMRRELAADLLRSRSSPTLTPFFLARSDGFTVGVDAREDHVAAPLLHSMEVVHSVFGAISGQLGRSDAGLYVERLMDMLGGVSQDGIALQPAVRAVLHKAATAPYGRPVAALVAEAKQRAGEWPESFFGRGRNYPAWAVQWLCDKGLLQARLKSKCPNCGNTLSVAPAELSNSVTCPLCLASRPLALHLTALRPEWRLALHKDVQPERLFETMPVMAALSLIAGARGYSGDDLHSAVGIRLSHAEVQCELDLVVSSRERHFPILIIGECKSYRDSITTADIDNLAKVQRLFLDQGVECYVLFATMRDRFDNDEVTALREFSAHVPSTLSFRPRQSIEALAPLVLDGRSMSTHSFSERSLLRVGAGPHSLANLAVTSCTHSLGLAAYAYESDEHREGFKATWAAPPA